MRFTFASVLVCLVAAVPSSRVQEAPSSDPDEIVAQASTMMGQGRIQEAEALLGVVLEGDPVHVVALRWRSMARGEMRDLDGARADIAKAIALEPGDSWSRYHHGWILQETGELEKSVEEYTAAIELDPRFAKPISIAPGYAKSSRSTRPPPRTTPRF